MKVVHCKPARRQAPSATDEFESAVVAELRQLRRSEKVLATMYPRLKTTPQLRERFLMQLAEMQQRAQRLDGVLNPLGALQFSAPLPAAVSLPVA
jgi:hypothetical protein